MNPAITFEDKTVLLVEDELFLIEKITEQLETLGVEKILTATTLEDARDHISDVGVAGVVGRQSPQWGDHNRTWW